MDDPEDIAVDIPGHIPGHTAGGMPVDDSARRQAAEQVYERLFGARDAGAPDRDPELGEILRRLIFGDVFATGELDDRTRELVTVTCLATLQTLPQLRAHAGAALNVGVRPVELREAVYQLAPFIGFPRTLNAVGVLDEVLAERGIGLPLPPQAGVTDETRHERGLEIQTALYGTEIRDALGALPAPFDTAIPDFLTDATFGDFWSRDGLDPALRELLALVALTALGLAPQLTPHVRGAIRAGNSVETVLAALVQAFPYIGFPATLNAVRVVLAQLDEHPGDAGTR